MKRFPLLICVAALLVCCPRVALADEADEKAVRHEEEAIRLYEGRQWPEAIRQWEQAYQLDGQPRFLFNIGQCYRKMNLHREAVDNFQRYLQDMEREDFRRDQKNRIDPTVKIDIESYITQMKTALDRLGNSREVPRTQAEPAPYLVADEIVDAEELFDQLVKEQRAGNGAVANDLVRRMEEVYRLRRDPLLLYYFARAYDQLGKRREALEYYRRYLAADPPQSPLRQKASGRFSTLTPAAPGQKYLWPGIVFAILGLGGVAAGTALYFEAQNNFERFRQPVSEDEKRSLRDRGDSLGLGTLTAFGAGGGCVVLSAILLGVAGRKGVRQKQVERGATPDIGALLAPPPLRLGLMPLRGGGGLVLEGAF